MQDKELKKLGWKLALLPSFRKWYQKSVMDFEKEKYERIEKENQYLKDMLKITEKRLEQTIREHHQHIKQILEDEQKDKNSLLYFKYGLRPADKQEEVKKVFPEAKSFAAIYFWNYPSAYAEGIKKRIEANTEELPNPAKKYIQRYFFNDSDIILIRMDRAGILAGLYNSRELYEEEKINKKKEISSLIDEMSR